jgi:hypothetical protein
MPSYSSQIQHSIPLPEGNISGFDRAPQLRIAKIDLQHRGKRPSVKHFQLQVAVLICEGGNNGIFHEEVASQHGQSK